MAGLDCRRRQQRHHLRHRNSHLAVRLRSRQSLLSGNVRLQPAPLAQPLIWLCGQVQSKSICHSALGQLLVAPSVVSCGRSRRTCRSCALLRCARAFAREERRACFLLRQPTTGHCQLLRGRRSERCPGDPPPVLISRNSAQNDHLRTARIAIADGSAGQFRSGLCRLERKGQGTTAMSWNNVAASVGLREIGAIAS